MGAPEPVLTSRADEWRIAASEDYLAWTAWNGKRNVTYAKEIAGSRFRINRKGYQAAVGAIDGTTLVYQDYTFAGRGKSDIWFFDLASRTRVKAPLKVSSKRWEYDPRLSGKWLLFARWFPTEKRNLYLYDREAQQLRIIASTSGGRRLITAGQVNGDYATYGKVAWNRRGRLKSCDVYRYEITSGTTERVPNPGSKCQWGSSVNEGGTVFFVRSGFGCGRNVSIRKHLVGGPTETVWTLRRNHDVVETYALDRGEGTTDLFFSTFRCGKWSDAKKIVDA